MLIPKDLFRPSEIIKSDSLKAKIIIAIQLFFIGKIIDLSVSIGKGIIRDFGLPYNIQKLRLPEANGGDFIFILV